jgi:hypothetical protein
MASEARRHVGAPLRDGAPFKVFACFLKIRTVEGR